MSRDDFYLRIAVWNDTLARAPQLVGAGSTKHTWKEGFNMPARHAKTMVAVVDADLVDTGKAFIKLNPLVLNLADDCFPGGCVYTGSGAAEESIFRRSNYFRTLGLEFYPIKANEAVYSPDVTVFKEGPRGMFRDYQPFSMSFVACPGIRHPKLQEDGHMLQEDLDVLRKKIELIMQIGYKHGHACLVLGALGCGAWKNNPHDVAKVFKEVVDTCPGAFRLVVFAIKTGVEKGYTAMLGSNRPCNYKVFKSILHDGAEAPSIVHHL